MLPYIANYVGLQLDVQKLFFFQLAAAKFIKDMISNNYNRVKLRNKSHNFKSYSTTLQRKKNQGKRIKCL